MSNKPMHRASSGPYKPSCWQYLCNSTWVKTGAGPIYMGKVAGTLAEHEAGRFLGTKQSARVWHTWLA